MDIIPYITRIMNGKGPVSTVSSQISFHSIPVEKIVTAIVITCQITGAIFPLLILEIAFAITIEVNPISIGDRYSNALAPRRTTKNIYKINAKIINIIPSFKEVIYLIT